MKKIAVIIVLLLVAAVVIYLYATRENRQEPEPETGLKEEMEEGSEADIVPEDSGESDQGLLSCEFLLAGGIEPLKDMLTFTDEDYTEVTIIARDGWDASRLPSDVTYYEEQGYVCTPLPGDFADMAEDGGDFAEPMVLNVEWTCELFYEDFEYLPLGSETLEGYSCGEQECDGADGKVLLCVK